MGIGKRRLYLLLLAGLLIGSLIILYFAPFTVTDHVSVWFSNHRLSGFTKGGETAIFESAVITSQGSDMGEWSGNGLEQDVYVGNVTVMSLSEGIIMWVNDSLHAYQFPVIADGDQYYSDKLCSSVLNVNISASKDGTEQIPIPYYNTVVLSPEGLSLLSDTMKKSYAYVDLDQVDALLGIHGEESYTLSISMDLFYQVNFPAPPFHASNPSQMTNQKTINFGNIIVSCVGGRHAYAHINFPYQELSFQITVPYVKTILSG